MQKSEIGMTYSCKKGANIKHYGELVNRCLTLNHLPTKILPPPIAHSRNLYILVYSLKWQIRVLKIFHWSYSTFAQKLLHFIMVPIEGDDKSLFQYLQAHENCWLKHVLKQKEHHIRSIMETYQIQFDEINAHSLSTHLSSQTENQTEIITTKQLSNTFLYITKIHWNNLLKYLELILRRWRSAFHSLMSLSMWWCNYLNILSGQDIGIQYSHVT